MEVESRKRSAIEEEKRGHEKKPHFANFHILEKLFQNRRTIVYRAVSEQDGRDVILKVITTLRSREQARSEFEIQQRIVSDFVVTCLETKEVKGYNILVEVDDHSQALSKVIPSCGFSLLEFLSIARQLAQGLTDIHYARVIHRDINPNNIIYNEETKKIKYIDFGSACVLRQYNKKLKLPPTLEVLYHIFHQNKLEESIEYWIIAPIFTH